MIRLECLLVMQSAKAGASLDFVTTATAFLFQNLFTTINLFSNIMHKSQPSLMCTIRVFIL